MDNMQMAEMLVKMSGFTHAKACELFLRDGKPWPRLLSDLAALDIIDQPAGWIDALMQQADRDNYRRVIDILRECAKGNFAEFETLDQLLRYQIDINKVGVGEISDATPKDFLQEIRAAARKAKGN